MSVTHGAHSKESLSAEEAAQLSPEEAMTAGAEADGIYIVHRRERFPIAGTTAEKRAERTIAAVFLLGFLSAVAFIVVFCGAVPFEWRLPGAGNQNFMYFTPLIGSLLGLSLACVGIGVILWAKWLLPEEEVVQDRHDGASDLTEQILVSGTLISGYQDLGLARRSMLKTTLGLAGGALGLVPLVALVGAMIKKPNRGEGQSLFHTPFEAGMPIVYADGRRVGPGDLLPGGVATVFPGIPGGVKDPDSPTLLIRLRPGEAVKARKGQENYHWGDYVAFSKICTHAGCAIALFRYPVDRETSHGPALVCPCHYSTFDVTRGAKVVFGPAVRSLPQLPLAVDDSGRLVAAGALSGPVGPSWWGTSR